MEQSKVDKDYLSNFFLNYKKKLDEIDVTLLLDVADNIKSLSERNGKLIIVGNGGSAAIASHAAVDFTKVGGIRSMCFNDSSIITCFANDYGYGNWVKEALRFYADKDDFILLISSSGESKNIVNAAQYCKEKEINFLSFTGFDGNNTLRKISERCVYVSSSNYNIVENTHQICILSLVDLIANNPMN